MKYYYEGIGRGGGWRGRERRWNLLNPVTDVHWLAIKVSICFHLLLAFMVFLLL